MTLGGPIKLRCQCGNAMDYDRSIDPSIPTSVAAILSTQCPECDDGGFGTETWFDTNGCELDDMGRVAFPSRNGEFETETKP
jgi:hypothetical protein